ncbi:MAG: glycosyltransferase [Reyranellaceae bacterium]
MARVLIGWELASSPDLLLDMADMAYELVRRGHDVQLAAGDPVTLATVLDVRLADRILPAPVPSLRADLVMKPPREGGLADKLALQGFAAPPLLAALAVAWRNLARAVPTDVAVAVGAPVLAFAMRGQRPLIIAGSAETLPPVTGGPLPRLHANIAPVLSEVQIVQNANAAAEMIGASAIAASGQLLAADRAVSYGLALCDPYASLRRERTAGPLLRPPSPVTPADRPAMTAVLDIQFPNVETLVMALTDFGQTPVHVHVRGMTQPMHAYLLENPAITVHPSAGEALAMAPQSSFVLHHAGARVATHCLGLGVPQILLPFTVEQNAVADMLQRANAGFRIGAASDPAAIADTLARLFRNLDMVQNAQHAARQIALDPPAPALPSIVAAVEELAGAA